MKKASKLGFFILARYLLLLLFVLTNILAFIIPAATVHTSFSLIKLFSNATLTNNIIDLNGHSIEINSACIALSAFYLMLILNLSTQMPIKKRLHSLLFTFGILFIINVLRIFVFSFLFVSSASIFSALHFMTWFIFSSIIVLLLWYVNIRIFNIKEIPVYSDIQFIMSEIKPQHLCCGSYFTNLISEHVKTAKS